jgi:hypothetical protein
MKIDGPKSSSEISKKKDAKKTSSGDGAFGAMLGGGDTSSVSDSAGMSMSSNIAGVDALLMAQAADDPLQGKAKRQMKERAVSILDKLNDLKVAMVSGKVTIGHMISIADVIASHRETITDPELSAILDEIDLRAHVELAKLQVAKSKAY